MFKVLESSSEKDALEVMRKLPANDLAWVMERNQYNKTPLHKAAEKGYCEVAQGLLDHNADVNAADQVILIILCYFISTVFVRV